MTCKSHQGHYRYHIMKRWQANNNLPQLHLYFSCDRCNGLHTMEKHYNSQIAAYGYATDLYYGEKSLKEMTEVAKKSGKPVWTAEQKTEDE